MIANNQKKDGNMPNNMEFTTGKVYKGQTRRCRACKRVFALTENQSKGITHCVCPYCGSSNLLPFQRTTAKLPEKE